MTAQKNRFRVSRIRSFLMLSVSHASIVHFGDCAGIHMRSRVFAAQRQVSVFSGEEGEANADAVLPLLPLSGDEVAPALRRTNEEAAIDVNFVRIDGVSVSSVIQIGGSLAVMAENGTKHVRHFFVHPSSSSSPE